MIYILALIAYVVLAIGVIPRYLFFALIGRKKSFSYLLEGNRQTKWNILMLVIMVVLLLTAGTLMILRRLS